MPIDGGPIPFTYTKDIESLALFWLFTDIKWAAWKLKVQNKANSPPSVGSTGARGAPWGVFWLCGGAPAEAFLSRFLGATNTPFCYQKRQWSTQTQHLYSLFGYRAQGVLHGTGLVACGCAEEVRKIYGK